MRLTQRSVIFIHGLRGHPRHTWEESRSVAGSSEEAATPRRRTNPLKSFFGPKPRPVPSDQPEQPSKVFWPEDYLIDDIPEVRVWTYGYDADAIGGVFQANNKNSVSQHGRDLAVKIEREVEKEVECLRTGLNHTGTDGAASGSHRFRGA